MIILLSQIKVGKKKIISLFKIDELFQIKGLIIAYNYACTYTVEFI